MPAHPPRPHQSTNYAPRQARTPSKGSNPSTAPFKIVACTSRCAHGCTYCTALHSPPVTGGVNTFCHEPTEGSKGDAEGWQMTVPQTPSLSPLAALKQRDCSLCQAHRGCGQAPTTTIRQMLRCTHKLSFAKTAAESCSQKATHVGSQCQSHQHVAHGKTWQMSGRCLQMHGHTQGVCRFAHQTRYCCHHGT